MVTRITRKDIQEKDAQNVPKTSTPNVTLEYEVPHRLEFTPGRRTIGPDEEQTIRYIFINKYEYIDNELFKHKPSIAEKKIFVDAPSIELPDTSWYHPVMDNFVSDSRVNKNVGTVLLTGEEERILFIQFNYCRLRVCKIRDKLKKNLDKPIKTETAVELLEWHNRAEALRDQIAQTNLALVLAMAKRTRMSEVDFADLVSEGNMALLRAVDKFDAARGFKFSTYACRAILKAFSRSGVKLSKYRQLFPTAFDPALERSNFQEEKNASHEMDCVDEVHKILEDNRAELSDIEVEVIKHRFGIDKQPIGDEEPKGMTLEQVGKVIGVTKERVRQIQNKALVKIRSSLETDFLE
ncbi:RNA polymerase sigma factor SigA [Poriferisphaera corsica]|uniref:RNA polymerase sigma factor SigA n=1 Tax=Poriferisphaera corsica TaxID=2528020 RepID=A0A517YQ88_9BACT|nr:sigma-70 family RNA polymerase sigma factor [Poriferisphaera corsica]QDU32386.1 RNA polymerase sigma factor SigA [Poriferisphaera corsica]